MIPTLVTHSGKFHCDEVFAYATLCLALDVSTPGTDHTLVRTRDKAAIAAGTIVWDVGLAFDPATHRFDHHQRGAPVREDGSPLSSAGLVWQVYGADAVRALLPAPCAAMAAPIAAELETKIVRRIDELDNGTGPTEREAVTLSSLVADCNPTWDDPAATGPTAGDAGFLEATALVTALLRRRVEALRSRMEAEALVLAAHAAATDPRLLVLDRGMPWKSAAFDHGLPVIYTISPASNGNWMIDTMPPERGSFAQRLPLPEPWAGLEGSALATATGVEDAVFVHTRRFVGAARSKTGAIQMATAALSFPHPSAPQL